MHMKRISACVLHAIIIAGVATRYLCSIIIIIQLKKNQSMTVCVPCMREITSRVQLRIIGEYNSISTLCTACVCMYSGTPL